MAFDTAKTELSRNNFAFGYKSEGTELHTSVNDGTEFGASIYQKVSSFVKMLFSITIKDETDGYGFVLVG